MTAEELLLEYHAHRAFMGLPDAETVTDDFEAEVAAFLADDEMPDDLEDL